MVKGAGQPTLEDYDVAETRKIGEPNVGLFAIFDGFIGTKVPEYLQSHLFNNIILEPTFVIDTKYAVREGYLKTNTKIFEISEFLEGSTAVTAILMDHHGKSNYELVVANVGNSRAVICCKKGVAKQLSVDHEDQRRTELLKVTRSFGIKSLQPYISCEPYVVVKMIDNETEFLVLASHPLWEELMSNQYVVNSLDK